MQKKQNKDENSYFCYNKPRYVKKECIDMLRRNVLSTVLEGQRKVCSLF